MDDLLIKELKINGINDWNCLRYFFMSRTLQDFNFLCRRFKYLLNCYLNDVSKFGETMLIQLCQVNPKLLIHDWACEIVKK